MMHSTWGGGIFQVLIFRLKHTPTALQIRWLHHHTANYTLYYSYFSKSIKYNLPVVFGHFADFYRRLTLWVVIYGEGIISGWPCYARLRRIVLHTVHSHHTVHSVDFYIIATWPKCACSREFPLKLHHFWGSKVIPVFQSSPVQCLQTPDWTHGLKQEMKNDLFLANY